MKINQYFFLIALLLTITSLTAQSNSESNSYFLQLGVGRTMLNHFEQIGFNQTVTSNALMAEIGQERGYWRVGAYLQTTDRYEYSSFQIERKEMGFYAKANLAPIVKLLPYGVDPYLYASTGMQKSLFRNVNDTNSSPDLINDKMNHSFGGGLDLGRKLLVMGVHYAYTPGATTFTDAELGVLDFQTTTHSLQLRLSIRLTDKLFTGGRICPRFGKKKKGQTRF